jgi:lysophospholipase L1-like esterase
MRFGRCQSDQAGIDRRSRGSLPWRPGTTDDMSDRIFTRGYLLYLLALSVVGIGVGHYMLQRSRPLTIADMRRDDYENQPGNMVRKIDRDGLLHDLAPNVTTMKDGVEYTTNSAGMRDDAEFTVAKPRGTRRIVFVGDSFTFGWGLQLAYTFPKQLAARLEAWPASAGRWEVINLGVPAYNTMNEVHSLEHKGLQYEPDVVVLMYHLNDALSYQRTALGDGPDTTERLSHYFIGDASPAEVRIVNEFIADRGYNAEAITIQRDLVAVPESRRIPLYVTYLITHRLPLYWDRVRGALDRLRDLSHDHGFDVLAALIPEIDMRWETYPFGPLHEQVAAAMQARGFRLVDLLAVLSEYPNDDLRLWGHDGHTSAFANYIIADVLEEHLAATYRDG